MTSTQSVLDHHLKCFGTADLEGTLSDYTPKSVVMTPDGMIKGLDNIRAFFVAAYAEFTKPGTTFSMKQMLVDGECAFIVWEAETPDNRFESATDTFIVRDSKILVQTYVAKVTSKAVAAL
jgi:ketosteroid isomerase-like protein